MSCVRDVYGEYEKAMKRNNALDFDDILLRTKQILEVPEVLAYFHEKFQYFMVDEYQDTNAIQYEIVRLLASATRNLCVVGDDWQGIYSWRGANIKNILNFNKDYPDAQVVKLEQNYRSTKTIIEAANKVVKNNSSALDKTLWTDNEPGEKITVVEAYDEKHEADVITDIIRDSGSYSKWAMLYRTNSQSRLFEEALMRKGIPYKIFGGPRFYERKEIKDMISYIRILLNPFDTMGFNRIINTPSRKIGAKTVETLIIYAKNYNMSIPEILENVGEIEEFTTAAKKSLAEFNLLYRDFFSYSREHMVGETIAHIADRIAYKAYLENEYGEEDGASKFDNVRELQNMAERYNTLEPLEAIRMFLEDIALLSEADNIENEASYVSLMTVHLSK
jgi:DNA helicase-2/ATP-dependent DNA helicase PcrA